MKVYAIRMGDEIVRMVKARGYHAALRHCEFTSKVATQDELIEWVGAERPIERTDAKLREDEQQPAVDPRQMSITSEVE